MKGTRLVPLTIVLVVLLVLSAGPSTAQGPAPQSGAPQVQIGSTFTYQGQLQKDGNPINATCAMTFTLYDDATAGNPVGSPINAEIEIKNGLFTVPLDFGSGIFTGDARWLGIAVRCEGDAGASTMSPRQPLTAAPYALSLRPGADIVGDTGSDAALYGLNTATAGYTSGVQGESASTGGRGVSGAALATSGDTIGVVGWVNSPYGIGVYGHDTSTTGDTVGVMGMVVSTDGAGVYGKAQATSGQADGVYGETWSTSGRGVVGWATAASGDARGVYGRSDSTEGYGVYGNANAVSGYTRGVYGTTNSPNGIGVYGHAADAEGIGVLGESTGNWGVWGQTDSGVGIYGLTNGSGVAVLAEGQSGGNLIEAWHGPMFPDRRFYVDDDGNVYADGTYGNPARGYAEMLPGAAGLDAGDVLVVGPDGTLVRCTAAYQPTVVGVYAPQAGFVAGAVEGTAGQVPLAVVGVVRVKVSAENGPIAAGDLLAAAATAGHAMRAGPDPALGTVIGKALEPLDAGTGTILMLVMLR